MEIITKIIVFMFSNVLMFFKCEFYVFENITFIQSYF